MIHELKINFSHVPILHSSFRDWQMVQADMRDTPRWSNFPAYRQNLGDHTNSIVVLCDRVIGFYRWPIDEVLLLRAAMYHDHGEPLTGGDVIYDKKTVEKDVLEWVAFCDSKQHVPNSHPRKLREKMYHAFLLQFCSCSDEQVGAFPDGAQKIIRLLQQEKNDEHRIFDFVQRLDYVFSAFQGHLLGVRNDEEDMLTSVLDRQVRPIDALTKQLPDMEAVWLPLRKFCIELVNWQG
ncbi:MAG: hypothetical protein AAGA35_02070 [Patescibacteria group bacterium]